MWSHLDHAGSAPVFQSTQVAIPTPTLSTHTASATILGNSVAGQCTITSDGTGGEVDTTLASFAFTDLVADGTYSVVYNVDPASTEDVANVSPLLVGVVTTADVAALSFVSAEIGMTASKTLVINYFVQRVG